MSAKQTRCPQCKTIYHVTQKQLTLAQGMVCCAKCNFTFNAITHLYVPVTLVDKFDELHHVTSVIQHDSEKPNVLEIFQQKIENSNIDLLTYLNNLKYFQSIDSLNSPLLYLSSDRDNLRQQQIKQRKSKHWKYYLIWCVINLILFGLLLLQIVWFNPELAAHYQILRQLRALF